MVVCRWAKRSVTTITNDQPLTTNDYSYSANVIVAGMIVFFVYFFAYRDHATVRGFAHHVFQLDRRMVDAKPVAEFFVDLPQNRVTL